MKNKLFTFLYLLLPITHWAQNTLTASYTSADIPTSYGAYDDSCNGPSATLTISLPAGDNYTVTSVNVVYQMTALGSGLKSEQRSLIKFQNTGVEEAVETAGTGNSQGTQSYGRTLTIANGTYSGGTELVFQMRARRTVEVSPGCHTSVNRVDASSWVITVHYSDEITNPKVGVNTSSPSQTMDVSGKLKLGDDTTAPQAGTIRWNATTNDFEGYNGQAWLSFTKNEGSDWGSSDITENGSIVASDGFTSDYFGYAVAVSGDYAIVGAYGRDVGANTNQGQAYVFKRNGSAWIEQDILQASDGTAYDYFGSSVAISGEYAIVGAYGKDVGANTNQGKVYIYHLSGSNWIEQADLVSSDGASDDYYGSEVVISGDYAIVSASQKNVGPHTNQGKIYFIKRTGVSWSELDDITSSDGATNDFFGSSLAISGDYAIVGASSKDIGANANQGKIYFFKRTGINWVEQDALTASDGEANDYFGNGVAISGDYAIAGAFGKNIESNISQGQVYIYKRNGSTWSEASTLTAADGTTGDYFGYSVSMDGDNIFISAMFKDIGINENQGKAYIYSRNGANWTQQATFVPSDGEADDNFGRSLSISGDQVMLGSYRKDVGATNEQGKVYFFSKD